MKTYKFDLSKANITTKGNILTIEVNNDKWRAQRGEAYYQITDKLTINSRIEQGNIKDNALWEIGNYFANAEIAQKVLDKIIVEFKQRN